MTLEDVANQLRDLTDKFRRHNHDGIETDELDIPNPPASPITVYDCTIVNVEDVTTETNIVSFTVPANTIAEGDIIKIHFVSAFKWHDSLGSATTPLTIKAKVAASTITIHSATQGSDSAEYLYFSEISFQRTNDDLWLFSNPLSMTGADMEAPETNLLNPSSFNQSNTQAFASFNSTTDNVFAISVKFNAAGTNYWRIHSAKAYKI